MPKLSPTDWRTQVKIFERFGCNYVRQNVLEISGTEAASELTRRHREKVIQALANPFGLDAYVVVCAFSEFGHLIRFSYHPWTEETHGDSKG